MTRKHPNASPLTAMQKVQLASAKQRLKIDAVRARQVEEVAAARDVEVNQFGRPIVAYEDLPELNEADQVLLNMEFERIACPHWAVAKYRPGFGPKNELRTKSRNSWYFYETGQKILRQLVRAVMNDDIPDFLETLSTDDFNMVDAFAGLIKYLEVEDAAKKEAVILHRTTVEKLDIKDKAELAKIRKDLDKRYDAIIKRNGERDNRPVKP